MAPRVLVIGAGPSGLVTLKECLAADVSVKCVEALPHIGGQWTYTEPVNGEVTSSVYESVILNSCRDTTNFSDFPMDPARYPDYFGHKRMRQYLDEYAEKFGLIKHVVLGTKVVKCEVGEAGAMRWRVVMSAGGKEEVEGFDVVFVCVGNNSYPMMPQFKGMEDFEGEMFHSHVYRRPGKYEGKRIAVIGIGSSGRFSVAAIPHKVSEYLDEKLLEVVTHKLPPAIKPSFGVLSASPVIRGDFLERIYTGQITPHRAEIERFYEHGLVLSNGEKLEVDVIICCTGYLLKYPYLPPDAIRNASNPDSDAVNLYNLIVTPRYENLFFIGQIQVLGPIFPISEIQARWCLAILSGKVSLPSPSQMNAAISAFQARQRKNYAPGPRHATLVPFLPYCDILAGDLGIRPTLGRLVGKMFTSNPWRAWKVLSSVYFSVSAPAQYRLFGEGRWEGAEATLLRVGAGGKTLSVEERRALGLKSGV